jgi:hypothetical protein
MTLEKRALSVMVCCRSAYACIPRLSAAITTPSLNLTAITDVPVTIGDCVCWFGPLLL